MGGGVGFEGVGSEVRGRGLNDEKMGGGGQRYFNQGGSACQGAECYVGLHVCEAMVYFILACFFYQFIHYITFLILFVTENTQCFLEKNICCTIIQLRIQILQKLISLLPSFLIKTYLFSQNSPLLCTDRASCSGTRLVFSRTLPAHLFTEPS